MSWVDKGLERWQRQQDREMQTNRTESGRRVEGPQQQEQCRHGEGNIREGEKLRKPGRRTEWGKERQAWDGLQAREQKVCVCVGGGLRMGSRDKLD